MSIPQPPAPDIVLREQLMTALRSVPMGAGITTRVPFGKLADAVLALGTFDVVLTDGTHLFTCGPCQHGDPRRHDTDYCPSCGAGCRRTFTDTDSAAEEARA